MSTILSAIAVENSFSSLLRQAMHYNRQMIKVNAHILPITQLADLPECPAVYQVIDETGEPLYVGSAKNLRKRWLTHHVTAKLLTHPYASILWHETLDYRAVERDWIRCRDPRYNMRTT